MTTKTYTGFPQTMDEGMLIHYWSLVNSLLKWTNIPNKIQYKYKFVNNRHQPTHRIGPIHHTTCNSASKSVGKVSIHH